MTSSIFGINWDLIFNNPNTDTNNTNNTNTNNTNTNNTNTNSNKTYYLLPQQIIPTKIPYLNVNNNQELRNSVTSYFLNKTIKWINNKEMPNNFKPILISHKGDDFMYELLRKYVNKHNINWYDLRNKHYESTKDYIIRKLSKNIK